MTILIDSWWRDALNGLALLVGYFLLYIQGQLQTVFDREICAMIRDIRCCFTSLNSIYHARYDCH